MRGWIVALLALTISVPAAAQDAPSPEPDVRQAPGLVELLGLTGAVRAGYWSSTRNLDSEAPLGAGMLWMKSTRRVSKRVSFLAEGWTSLQGPLEDGTAAGELREAFVDLRFGKLDVRAGRQIIAWGRADVRAASIQAGSVMAAGRPG